MTDRSDNVQLYVAPLETPTPRRPPITEIGIVAWLKTNLFNSVWDTVITIITLVLVLLFMNSTFRWLFLEAQWDIVFLNIRQINLGGQFPQAQVWRAELMALIILFLSMLSVGVWGNISRGVVGVIGFIIALMIFVPFTRNIAEKPSFYVYASATYNMRQVNFVADAGQEITFTIEPLTTVEDFRLVDVDGYIENNNQQSNTSFDSFTQATTDINFTQTLDPTEYDMSIAVQVWDRDGRVIAESPFTEGSRDELIFTWEAPAQGWYTFTLARDDETSTAGAAWLKVDNIDVFRNTPQSRSERIATYGEPPVLDCPNCNTQTNLTDTRFEGERTLLQWFSLQLSPYLEEVRGFFFVAVAVGFVAYQMGKLSLRVNVSAMRTFSTLENLLLVIALIWFIAYISIGLTAALNPDTVLNTLRTMILVALVITLMGYATLQFVKEKGSISRGVSLLWLLSLPVMLMLLNGFQVTPTVEGPQPLPAIPSSAFGGLLLTLLLSAIAIIVSFPIGMALALGRQSNLPVVRLLSTLFIELVRGVPLITLLFMGRLILPFFGFGLGDVDLLIRISVVLTFFTSAYLAEVIRGGLQIIPRGQIEAAYAVGLNNFWTTVLIILPQALRAVIPAIMGQAVSLFKDTSLVFIVGLFEILGTMNVILSDSQTGYSAFPREGYLYIGIIYFVFSYVMADVSRRIERSGSGAIRRETL